MGNKTSSSNRTPSPSPPPPSAEVAKSKDKAPVEREVGDPVDPPIAISSPPTAASPEPRPVSLHLESPTPIRSPKDGSNLASPSFGLLTPIISVSISPPPISTGDQSRIFSGRVTTPSPAPSPRSQISVGSSITSAGARAASFFWNLQEQYYHRKIARRQSQLESAGRLGRPCCFTLQSITLQGTFPSTAQVQAEVTVLFEKAQPYLNHISELPPLRTSPRPPLRPGQVNIGGKADLILLPSVTSSSVLSVTVLLDGVPIGNVRYPLSEITATLRPTELRLTPAGADGKKTPRSRSPSLSSPFSSPLRRRHLSSASPVMSSPYKGGDNSDLMGMGLESLRLRTPSVSPPPPTTSAISSSSSSSRPSSPLPPRVSSPQAGGGAAEAAAAGEGPPRLYAVWGEVVFYDNRSSGVGWVDLVEEGGKPVNEQRLLVVTPQSFALMKSPHCILGQEGYSMTEVRHVEPKDYSPLLPEKADDLPRNISSGTTTPPTSSNNSSSSTGNDRPPGAGGGGGGGGGGAIVTISVSCPEKGDRDILLALDSGEDARRWTQLLKRAAQEAAFGGAEKS